jgi:hypothetical protein
VREAKAVGKVEVINCSKVALNSEAIMKVDAVLVVLGAMVLILSCKFLISL